MNTLTTGNQGMQHYIETKVQELIKVIFSVNNVGINSIFNEHIAGLMLAFRDDDSERLFMSLQIGDQNNRRTESHAATSGGYYWWMKTTFGRFQIPFNVGESALFSFSTFFPLCVWTKWPELSFGPQMTSAAGRLFLQSNHYLRVKRRFNCLPCPSRRLRSDALLQGLRQPGVRRLHQLHWKQHEQQQRAFHLSQLSLWSGWCRGPAATSLQWFQEKHSDTFNWIVSFIFLTNSKILHCSTTTLSKIFFYLHVLTVY